MSGLEQIASDVAELKTTSAVTANEMKHLVDRLPSIEARVTTLEAWRWKAAGVVGVVVAVGIPVAGVIAK